MLDTLRQRNQRLTRTARHHSCGILAYSVPIFAAMTPQIRRLTDVDAPAWWQLRLQALESDPFAFGKTVEEHRASTIETFALRFRDPQSHDFTLGAFDGATLIGIATFVREPSVKERHKAHIYGVYVTPVARGKGVARALIASIIETARQIGTVEQLLLAVGHTQTAARNLYLSLGFETFGTEPNALKVGTSYINEHHMILRIS